MSRASIIWGRAMSWSGREGLTAVPTAKNSITRLRQKCDFSTSYTPTFRHPADTGISRAERLVPRYPT
ncbi:MAG TPA: hypothetical protein VME20_05840 [Acidimicrobiales bacterium]|nr:hypothetical protein [Acidimicrobiales bacterium]